MFDQYEIVQRTSGDYIVVKNGELAVDTVYTSKCDAEQWVNKDKQDNKLSVFKVMVNKQAKSTTRKTMRINGVRTSFKIEECFWSHLKEEAVKRKKRLSQLVQELIGEVEVGKRASFLRVWCFTNLKNRNTKDTQINHSPV